MHALFLQCTAVSHYPPILNAAALMADAGWQVTTLSSPGGDAGGLTTGDHPRVEHLSTRPRRGNRVNATEYLVYVAQTAKLALRLRPHLIYASDPLSALPALVAARTDGAAIVYHEHDSPFPGALRPQFARCRAKVARRARLVIAPNAERGRIIQEDIGFSADRLRTVWNMPRLAEAPALAPSPADPLIVYYHGSITPERVPPAVVEAVNRSAGAVRLRIAGYEAPSARGYVQVLVELGRRPTGGSLVEYLGQVPLRTDLLSAASHAHVGLALMPLNSEDLNMRHMTGASNKPFDYMASGLALLVSDQEEWRKMFVAPGYARACDPADPTSIAWALDWFVRNKSERQAMAARGRAKIEADWNYDTAFAPILADLAGIARTAHE